MTRSNWMHSPRGTFILRKYRNNIDARFGVAHQGTRRDGNPVSRMYHRWIELG